MADLARRLRAAVPVAVLGAAVLYVARDFPPVPGQGFGPGLFPVALGLLLIGCAVGVVLQAPPPGRPPASARGRLGAIAYAVSPVIVLLAWESLGWPLIATGLGAMLLIIGGMRWLPALGAGAGFAAATWVLFAMLLRVPLPRGPLTFIPY